jgi:hypothetical protein
VYNKEKDKFLKRVYNLSQGLMLGIKPSITSTINTKTGLIIDTNNKLAPK